MENQEFLAEFGYELGLEDKKLSNGSTNSGDILSTLLSVTKNKQHPIVQETSKSKKKEDDVEESHEYFKRALKPIKGSVQKPKLFTPKNETKEVAYQQKIRQAKNVLEKKSKQKKYKPKIVDYLGVGDWNNFKKDGNDKPNVSRIDNEKKEKPKDNQKRKNSYDEPRKSLQRERQKQKERERERNSQSRKIEEQRFKLKQQQRQRERQKQRSREKRERSREKQRQRTKQKQRQAQKRREKQRQRIREKQSQREKQRQRQKRQKELKQRQAQRQKRFREHKKKKHHDQDDYQDDGFVVNDDQKEQGWKKQINKLINKQKRDQVYAIRDKEDIAESSARQILGEDRISARYGREEEEADWRREEEEKRRRAERKRREEERRRGR